jgi:hypothetical protein
MDFESDEVGKMSAKLAVKVVFCGATLEGVVMGEKAYVAMKPIVEGMGLDWDKQLARIKEHPVLSPQLSPIRGVTGADGKRYEMMCLPESALPFWMALINPNRVKATIRDKIIRYQIEAADVLHRAFTQGVAETNLRVMAIDSKRAAGKLMSDVKNDFLVLNGKTPKPHDFSNEHRLVNWALTGEFDAVDEQSLDATQLRLLAELRRRNAVLIGVGLSYALRKEALKAHAASWWQVYGPAAPQVSPLSMKEGTPLLAPCGHGRSHHPANPPH